MITYSWWKEYIDDIEILEDVEKIGIYFICSLFSVLTIPLDIITLPFQLIGLIIWLITRRKQ